MSRSLEEILAEHRANLRYFLRPKAARAVWQEVTQEEFVQAERAEGFYPKPGCGPVATSGFGGRSQEGTSISLEQHLPNLGRYIDLDGELHGAR